jgi:hypothetical protein
VAADEAPHGRLGAEIAPAEDQGGEAYSPAMLALELDHHGDALVLGEEALFGCVRLSSDLDLQCRVGADVADPVGVRAQPEKMTASCV